MKKISLKPAFFAVFLSFFASCDHESKLDYVNIISNVNNKELSRLSSDSPLYKAIMGEWRIARKQGKDKMFFWETWEGLFADFSQDSLKIIEKTSEYDLETQTFQYENRVLYKYKFTFHAPDSLFFDNEKYKITRLSEENNSFLIGNDESGVVLEK